MTFLLYPSTWLLILIAGIVGRARGVTKLAATGLICYPLSFAISNAYAYVPYFQAILLWQAGLLALLAMYSFVGRQWWATPIAGMSIVIYALDWITRYDFEFIIAVLVTVVVYRIYRREMYPDILAKMVWGVLLIFEGWSALEIPGCRVFAKVDLSTISETWGKTVGTSVCEVAFGPIAPFFITGVTAVLMARIIWRWKKYQNGLKGRSSGP